MLLAILLLYLVTEMPNGIVTLLSGLLGEVFQNCVYTPLGEIFDILALINSGINFILLASMSRLFRKTFCKIFWPQRYHNHFQRDHPPTPHTEKTHVNHHLSSVVRQPNAVLLNQSVAATTASATTSTMVNRASASLPTDGKMFEMKCVDAAATTAVITVTEASQGQHEVNNEATMV